MEVSQLHAPASFAQEGRLLSAMWVGDLSGLYSRSARFGEEGNLLPLLEIELLLLGHPTCSLLLWLKYAAIPTCRKVWFL